MFLVIESVPEACEGKNEGENIQNNHRYGLGSTNLRGAGGTLRGGVRGKKLQKGVSEEKTNSLKEKRNMER